MKRLLLSFALVFGVACLGAAPAMAKPAPAAMHKREAVKAAPQAAAPAETDLIRIGVLTDLSGSMAGAAGHGSIEAAEMAVDDAARLSDRQVTLVTADYQSRSDLAQHITEDWIKRQNIDMVVDVPNTVIAARLQDLFRNEKRLLLSSTPLRPDDTANACGANGAFWLYDRETLSSNLIRGLLADHKQRWFIVGGDSVYALGLANSVKTLIQQNGGEITGEAYLNQRFSGLADVMEQVKLAKADIVFLALERQDTLHVLRHWPDNADKNIPPLALNNLHISDLADIKEKPLPPFYLATSFYWNQDTNARAFSDRFAARNRGMMPTAIHAAVYSAVYHYLRSVQATGRKSADIVLAHMKAQALQDGFFLGGHIRADGVVLHPVYLLLSKTPEEREGPFDYFKVARTLGMNEEIVPPQMPCPEAQTAVPPVRP
jgi:branched-chain amino acid transport system substrate-binding protein